MRIGQSAITGNTSASWQRIDGTGSLLSYADNYIDGNGDGDPVPTAIARK